jgi:hypothetical protein
MAAIVDTGVRPVDFIVSEPEFNAGRDTIVVESGSGIVYAGTVMGKKTTGGATSAAKAGGNTGNGTFVLDATAPVQAGAKAGIYTLRIITAVANGGVARLTDPDGFVLGDYTIPPGAGNSVTITNDIKGVLTDGATDFIVGDGFDITVAAGSTKWVPSPDTAVTGAQTGAALPLYTVDATSADVKVAALTSGPSQVNQHMLRYHTSVNDDTKKAAKWAQLQAAGIKVR